jgi:hypothetical protein
MSQRLSSPRGLAGTVLVVALVAVLGASVCGVPWAPHTVLIQHDHESVVDPCRQANLVPAGLFGFAPVTSGSPSAWVGLILSPATPAAAASAPPLRTPLFLAHGALLI